jgi:sugar-specific transcriptional regulator TrmB
MNNELLISLGLTADEATIYNILLEGGFMPARTVALRASLGRPLTYKILDDLIVKGVVEKKELGKKVSLFSPVHPRELEKLLEKKKEEVDNTKKALDESIGQMISKYNLFIGKPNVQFYEGIEGIKKVHDYMVSTAKEIYLIQSPKDKVIPESKSLIDENIQARIKMGIKTRAITPLSVTTRLKISHDSEKLIERRIIDDSLFPMNAQILVHENIVSMVDYNQNNIITTIIENTEFADTFKTIFNFMWEKIETDQPNLISRLKN